MSENLYVAEGRDDLPIFIHSELDDLDITPEAFRVYAHLARRAGKHNAAWPSYASIGERCFRKRFPNATGETLRRKAMAAVKELVSLGLIRKQETRKEDGSHGNNNYALTSRREWRGGVVSPHQGGVTAPEVVSPHQGGVTAPKGTPIKDSPSEGSPNKKSRSRSKDATHPMTRPVTDAYVECLGFAPPPSQFRSIGPDAKAIAVRGYGPEDVKAAYEMLQSENFWRDKVIPLGKVLEKIELLHRDTTRRNGVGINGQSQTNEGSLEWTPELLERAKAARDRGDMDEFSAIVRGDVR